MTLSPPLLSMMTDELLVERYHRYLDRLITLAEKEVDRTPREDPRFTDLAQFYVAELGRRPPTSSASSTASNLLGAFRKHRDAGKLEIITCGATHGFLPADGHRARRRCARRSRWRAEHYRSTSAAPRGASGCRSAATCRGRSASWRRRACATSSSSRTA